MLKIVILLHTLMSTEYRVTQQTKMSVENGGRKIAHG